MVIKGRALIWRVVTRKSENVVCGKFRVVTFSPKLGKESQKPLIFYCAANRNSMGVSSSIKLDGIQTTRFLSNLAIVRPRTHFRITFVRRGIWVRMTTFL